MGEQTKIEWADHSWSGWMGCQKVHAGCTNCYAVRQTARLGVKWGPDGTRVKTSDAYWRKPVIWDTKAENVRSFFGGKGTFRPRVFPSLCDPFEDWDGPILSASGKCWWQCERCSITEALPHHTEPHVCKMCGRRMLWVRMSDLRRDMFGLIDQTPNLDWLLLTKRPENIRCMMPARSGGPIRGTSILGLSNQAMYRDNVWLLYSASDQDSLEAGIRYLLKCRDLVPVLGLSLEPLVGPIDLTELLTSKPSFALNVLSRGYRTAEGSPRKDFDPKMRGKPYDREVKHPLPIDWVIAGGESGPSARPCQLEWLLDVKRQCEEAHVPLFIKQWGSHPVFSAGSANGPVAEDDLIRWKFSTEPMPSGSDELLFRVKLKDSKGGDPKEWPESIRVQQYPEVAP